MNTHYLYIGTAVAVVLLIPYVLHFPWTLLDYIAAAILVAATGIALEVTSRIPTHRTAKVLIGIGIVVLAAYVWAELAVGIVTNLGS